MRILLLSAYDAGSHRYWRESLVAQFPEHEWTQLCLPARHFSWRLRGAPLGWLAEQSVLLNAGYDRLVATSMVDLATLRGLVPGLASIPATLYMHENQFAYPVQQGQQGILEAQMVTLYAALAADQVIFNSVFNRDSFLEGVNGLLKRLPDYRPKRIEMLLGDKVSLLPVPLLDELTPAQHETERFTLVWNHRWEYDKGPERLLMALEALEQRGVDYQLILLGEKFRHAPAAMEQIERRFARRLLHSGYATSRREYLGLLSQATLVLSTALHEFQGVALMEAAAMGARPRAPNRLCYPGFLPQDCLYLSHENARDEAQALAERIVQDYHLWNTGELGRAPDMRAFQWRNLRAQYASVLSL